MTQATIADILGGEKVFQREVQRALDMADAIAEGLPAASAWQVRDHLRLSEPELASLLGVSTKTLQRLARQPQARLSTVQSDRLYRVARIFGLAEQVLEDAESARRWLKTPAFGLDQRIPLDLLRTEIGARQVENLLGCIQHGLYV
jgi:putative toxin-antitoxin system antitoxin component (TIGR02293 family)